MLFSVIVPTHNRAELLGDALDSVLVQTHRDFEVIVIDDGSTDTTAAVMSDYKNRALLLAQPNRGPGAARNAAVRHASGEYLAFLDSDDLWFPWTLETYAAVVATAGAPAFVAGRPRRFCQVQELAGERRDAAAWNAFADYFASADEWRWWGASSFVVRRDMFLAVGGFTSEFVNGEDSDLAMRLGTAPGFVEVMAPSTFAYREHTSNIKGNLDRTVRGATLMVSAERCGGYPGGVARATERQRILTRHIRPVTLGCLSRGLYRDAWRLYREIFWWNIRLLRWKYLVGFPIRALLVA